MSVRRSRGGAGGAQPQKEGTQSKLGAEARGSPADSEMWGSQAERSRDDKEGLAGEVNILYTQDVGHRDTGKLPRDLAQRGKVCVRRHESPGHSLGTTRRAAPAVWKPVTRRASLSTWFQVLPNQCPHTGDNTTAGTV